ncbi:Group-specific protein [Bacillus wiedmannii]
MSDGMQLFIIFIFVLALFSIINFLAISLSGHNFKRRIISGFIFSLLTPIVFLTTAAFAFIFDTTGLRAGTLAFIVAIVYI